MVAKSGDHLLKDEAQNTLISDLLPLAYVITPNIYETEALTQMKIGRIEDMKTSAEKIHKMGVKNVIIKGGSLFNNKYAVDLFFNGSDFFQYQADRIDTNNTHGSGCTFASAIAAEIAKGVKIKKAIHIAKAYLTTLIKNAQNLNIGNGHGPLNHFLSKELEIDLNSVKVNRR
jgi:hydroxymethylpyrimidine/phosphomethylpyrimidine kinase